MREYEFAVVIERDEDGRYVAICPGLHGCYTEGESVDEATELIEDAIRLHLEARLASNRPIYEQIGGTNEVRVAI